MIYQYECLLIANKLIFVMVFDWINFKPFNFTPFILSYLTGVLYILLCSCWASAYCSDMILGRFIWFNLPTSIYTIFDISDSKILVLTHNMRGLSYLSLTSSISLLLMPWLLVSAGHQHPSYWLSRIGKSLSYRRNDFNNPCHVILEEW